MLFSSMKKKVADLEGELKSKLVDLYGQLQDSRVSDEKKKEIRATVEKIEAQLHSETATVRKKCGMNKAEEQK